MRKGSRLETRRWHASTSRATSSIRSGTTPSLHARHNIPHEALICACVLSADYPVGEIVFFRSAFAVVPVLAWLGWRGDLMDAVRTASVGGHVLRGLMGGCGTFAGFMALSFLPLSDAVAIGYASPLMTVVLAAVILKETVRAYRWTAVAIGFAGVLIMLLPHLDLAALARGPAGGPAVGVLFSLLAACCAAGA